ncbi:hypothetical protein IJ21_28950 [Paenibacillus sp. 32O-W]|nr:hypothetical protein IJ21_28950 [Paenibacillus sp. 32O-W]
MADEDATRKLRKRTNGWDYKTVVTKNKLRHRKEQAVPEFFWATYAKAVIVSSSERSVRRTSLTSSSLAAS